MSVPAEVLRELGAATRTFRSVKGAVLWYRDQLARRLSAGVNLEGGSAPVSAERRQQTHATFAAIAMCLKPTHWADIEARPLETQPSLRWPNQRQWHTGESLCWLLAWYENGADDGTENAEDADCAPPARRNPDAGDLALQAGIARRVFNRRCAKIRDALRVRMRADRLLLDSDGR